MDKCVHIIGEPKNLSILAKPIRVTTSSVVMKKLWVYDVHDLCIPGEQALFEGRDPYGVKYDNRIGSIWLYNRETQQRKLMTIFLWGGPHPRHPHAVFSQDDSMISFVAAASMTNENTRIAVIGVSE